MPEVLETMCTAAGVNSPPALARWRTQRSSRPRLAALGIKSTLVITNTTCVVPSRLLALGLIEASWS
jgi:hypothetical protein